MTSNSRYPDTAESGETYDAEQSSVQTFVGSSAWWNFIIREGKILAEGPVESEK
jgi:hypothetical protein